VTKLLNLFPGIADKHYFQDPETKEFWFHATAVCKEMGFENPSRTLMMHCDDDEKFQEVYEGKSTWFVSEAGIYGLAMISKTERAKEFKRWIKHDILPKLRATGGYIMESVSSEQIQPLQQELNAAKAKLEKSEYQYTVRHQENSIELMHAIIRNKAYHMVLQRIKRKHLSINPYLQPNERQDIQDFYGARQVEVTIAKNYETVIQPPKGLFIESTFKVLDHEYNPTATIE
jgi:prophage antirepressor-like protein